MNVQLGLFPQRVTVRMLRRIAVGTARLFRWRREQLQGEVLRRWRDLALIRFDGRKRDGSARGCTALVSTVLPTWASSPAETLLSAMANRRGGRRASR